MEKKSQKQIVKEILESKGEIDNLWCIQNGIWRLSAIILQLRRDGLNLETIYEPEKTKVCRYKLIPKTTLF